MYQAGKLGEAILAIEEKRKRKIQKKIRKISKTFREAKKNGIGTITRRIRTYYINTD